MGADDGLSTERPTPVVLISYSHEDPDGNFVSNVHRLAAALIRDGVDARIDLSKDNDEDWITWMSRQIEVADYVLCMINGSYKQRFNYDGELGQGNGVGWEAGLIKRELYANKWQNPRFLPCYFDRSEYSNIPTVLTGYDHYLLDSDAGYKALLRKVLDKPESRLPKPGPAPDLLTTEITPLFPRPEPGHGSAGSDPECTQNSLSSVVVGGQIELVERLLARLNREEQRGILNDFLAQDTGVGERARTSGSLAVVAAGRDHDSLKIFALCCLDTFADCLLMQTDKALLELLHQSHAIPVRSDRLRGGAERLHKIWKEETSVVPDDGWAVLYCKTKSGQQATAIAAAFVRWREQANKSGCQRKMVLVLINEENALNRFAKRVAKRLTGDSACEGLCQLDQLKAITWRHILAWRTYLSDSGFPGAYQLQQIVDRQFGDAQPSLPMLTIRDQILKALEHTDLGSNGRS